MSTKKTAAATETEAPEEVKAAETEAEAAEEKAAAAPASVKAKPAPKGPVMKKIRAPLARGDEQNLIIGINGKNWSIPQDGREYEVPDYVAFEYERAMAAERKFYEKQIELKGKSQFA